MSFQTPHVYINCHECSSSRRLFERILLNVAQLDLSSWASTAPPKKKPRKNEVPRSGLTIEDGETYFNCRTGSGFIQEYEYLCSQNFKTQQRQIPIILVLDNIERVRNYADDDPLSILCRMSEYVDAEKANRLVLVTISNLPWSKLFVGGRYTYGGPAPLQIPFPGYSKQEAMDVLRRMQAKSAALNKGGYRDFLKLMFDVFYSSCQDVLELDYQIRPLLGSHGDQLTTKSVWKTVSASAAKQGVRLLLRNSDSTANMSQTSKYLLVAAFCASYNPRKMDKRFFLKVSGTVLGRG